MSNGLSQVALQSCVSYAAFDELFRRLSISRWVLPLCYRGWIMVTRHWLASRLACLTVSSPSSTRQLDRSIAGLRRSDHITDALASFEQPSSSSLNWRSSSTELFMALHLSTCRINCSTSPICRRDTEVACARRLPVFLKSARHDVSLSAIAHLPLLAHDSGTVYLMISSLPHRSQHFANN